MRNVAVEVIARRRANPTDKKDLLNAILFGKDPQTGERLTDESIMNNMITFLIAGHETTSGLLSFTTYYLLSNPEAMQKAQQEVDRVVGREPIVGSLSDVQSWLITSVLERSASSRACVYSILTDSIRLRNYR